MRTTREQIFATPTHTSVHAWVSTSCSQLGAQEEAYARSAASAAQEAAAAATQAVEALVAGLHAQATDLTSFAQQQRAAAEEAGAAVRALAGSACSSLQGVGALKAVGNEGRVDFSGVQGLL